MRKGKRKETNKETQTSDRKPTKGKEQDHLKRKISVPLGKGYGLTQTKSTSRKDHKLPKQNSKTTKNSPCTHASSP
jgi:hypothetical protein